MTKSLPLGLLVTAGLLSSTAPASAYITYGLTTVNGTQYDLSPFADLSNANLTHANLTGANINFANLTGANLSTATLDYSLLAFADFTRANLVFANLNHAILTFADLPYANLSFANLIGAQLFLTDLTGVNLTFATVSYSNWTDFSTNSGATGLSSYSYNTRLIFYAGPAPVPEPSTYGLIGIGALGVAFAARRRKVK